ncbi:MAG: hypothetical protein J7K10_01820 [Thermodesulfobacterium sp.]|nr:hypothetical protein [Thermodesulfobacterium sp.]
MRLRADEINMVSGNDDVHVNFSYGNHNTAGYLSIHFPVFLKDNFIEKIISCLKNKEQNYNLNKLDFWSLVVKIDLLVDVDDDNYAVFLVDKVKYGMILKEINNILNLADKKLQSLDEILVRFIMKSWRNISYTYIRLQGRIDKIDVIRKLTNFIKVVDIENIDDCEFFVTVGGDIL